MGIKMVLAETGKCHIFETTAREPSLGKTNRTGLQNHLVDSLCDAVCKTPL
jgi:hypothetical protein